MKLTGTFLLITLLLAAIPVKAEVAEIRNPSWQKIPNTGDRAGEAPSVDVNGVVRSGDIVRYDTVTSDGTYYRVEANCRTNQFRAIRQGFFESRTRVNFRSLGNSSWSDSSGDPYKRNIFGFVCNLSSSAQSPVPQSSQRQGTVRFTNPNWRVVPGAEVGRHPAETLMNMNSLSKQGEVVTFEIIGYKGFYRQMTGSCSTRQVAVTREGLQTRDGANYREIAPNEVSITSWHRQLLLFACQNSSG